MAKVFDATLKELIDRCAADWVQWIVPHLRLAAGPVELLDPDLSVLQPMADKVFRLGPRGLLHLEVQSRWDGEMARRLLLYNVLLNARYETPVRSVVLLLRRSANSPHLTGTLSITHIDGQEYHRFQYDVIRLWELSADALLSGTLGLTPLGLLTDDAEPRLPALVGRFAERAKSETDTSRDAEWLLTSAFLLLGLRYHRDVLVGLFRGDIRMRESSTYQWILEEGRTEGITQGITQGRTEGALFNSRQSILDLLSERFSVVPPEVEARILATTDLERLRAAFRKAVHMPTVFDLPL